MSDNHVILSIIITTYNQQDLTEQLLDILAPQLVPGVEILVIDDGSAKAFKTNHDNVMVIRKRNGGASTARNRGIKESLGEYVSFIDGDDMVSDNYIRSILKEIEYAPFDVCDLSWRSLNSTGRQYNWHLTSRNDRLSNPSACTRVFNRTFIGDVRFNEQKDSTEDEEFTRHLGVLFRTDYRHTAISDYLYFYRADQPGSKCKEYHTGIYRTKKIVYYYQHVTADMTGLLEEIREKDKQHEVWLMTEQCDIPDLKWHCQIYPPHHTWAHEFYGEPYPVEIIPQPIRTQVVIYSKYFNPTGGITSFTYNWCQHMRKYYDITVLYGDMPPQHISRFSQIVRTVPESDLPITCDTLIINRITDSIPENVIYSKVVQMCHCVRLDGFSIPQDRDDIVLVSEASRDSWDDEAKTGTVINNMPYGSGKRSLLLVSATRIGDSDKGNCDERMRTLARMLDGAGIPWLWFNFAKKQLSDMPDTFINLPPHVDIQPYIARADYLIQLSDQEACSMSVLEALTNNTPVIVTPFASALEQGFVDTVTGYQVPYDMNFDVTRLLNIPQFTFQYDTNKRINQWRDLLGRKAKMESHYTPPKYESVTVLQKYHDVVLNTVFCPGDVVLMTSDRVRALSEKGLVKRI